jgi:hypothetical protein
MGVERSACYHEDPDEPLDTNRERSSTPVRGATPASSSWDLEMNGGARCVV